MGSPNTPVMLGDVALLRSSGEGSARENQLHRMPELPDNLISHQAVSMLSFLWSEARHLRCRKSG